MAQRGLHVRILGDLSRAPAAVQQAAASVEATSARMARKCGTLNIMFSYTATDEISRALASREAAAALSQPAAHVAAATGLRTTQAGCNTPHPDRSEVMPPVSMRPVVAEADALVPSALQKQRQHANRNGVLHARVHVPAAQTQACASPRSQMHIEPGAFVNGAASSTHDKRPREAAARHHERSNRAGGGGVNACDGPPCTCSDSQSELYRDIDSQLLTKGSPPVDLLVRTSGESRLSDYMVWQCRHAQLAWVPDLWPALSFSTFVRCVLDWQRCRHELVKIRDSLREAEGRCCKSAGNKAL